MRFRLTSSVGKLRLVAAELRLGLRQSRLIWTRIDLGQDIAAMDLLAFDEADRLQQPGDLATDRRGVQRLDRPEAAQDNWDVVLLCGRRHDGHGRGRRRRRGGP